MAGQPNTAFDDIILARMAEGESLRSICRDLKEHGCPIASAIRYRVIKDIPPGFAEQYAHAREQQVDALADDIRDIADDGTNDFMTIKRGGEEVEVVNNEAIQRSRLRVDTLKWIMSKIAPKKYGEKLDLTNRHEAGDSLTQLLEKIGIQGGSANAKRE